MTTSTIEIPPGAPAEWPQMSWRTREQWLALHRPAPGMAPKRAPAIEAGADLESPAREAPGRRVWSEQEMRAAGTAARRARDRRGPALTPDQVDAFRAYQRWHYRRSRARTGKGS